MRPWPRTLRVLVSFGAVALSSACRGGMFSEVSGDAEGKKGGYTVFRELPSDPSECPATGALVLHSFGPAMLQCTGTAIAPRVVLTAAHCVGNISKERLQFTLSHDVMAAPAVASVRVRRAYIHPGYDLHSSGSMHDIALMELDAPLQRSAFESVLSAADAPAVLRPRAGVELVGYSGRSHLGEKSTTRARITSVRADEMVIGGAGEPQGCEGDSGGPVLILDAGGVRRIAGLVSRSANDATECVDGSIATRVDAHDRWLASTLAAIDADEQ